MKLEEKDYLVGLAAFNGIGPKRLGQLQEYFGLAKKIWQVSVKSLMAAGLGQRLTVRFDNYRKKTSIISLKLWLENNLIKVITIDEENYPKLLKEISNPPFLIFVKSAISFEKEWNNYKTIAVVGSRRATAYGQQATQKLTAALVERGWVIVSGLARGVDRIAHQAALDGKGKTIAVLGHGLDKIYPPEHHWLAKQISQHGALVSEMPPFSAITKGNFVIRNRIVAGLSQGVLVTEGAGRSGTKITTRYAADFGREVFAVPGSINNPMSQAPADLIKLGAKLVTNVEDIIEEFSPSTLDK
ncbi:DNA-processing protein DprA [Patescibacteria group bacterium]|nr:DNA-processing protein DprA [Patescibacteria group bacterium]MBU1931593.1 DNA-processing protein DprA [Patescibacteria group bacterium]